MRKWIPLLIVAAGLIASAVVYQDLPERMPTHWNLSGEIDGWSPRLWGAFMMPVIIIFLWALMRWLPSIDPRARNYEKFGGAFEGMMIAVMLFILALHVITLRAALGAPMAMERAIPVGIGLLFIVIGNLLPRARSNWFVGIRTPWTLSSDRVWEKTHRVGGRLFVLGGIVIALSTFLGPRMSNAVFIAAVVICSLGAVVYSYLAWRKEKSAASAAVVLGLVLFTSLGRAEPVRGVERDTTLQARIDTVAPATVVESPFSIASGTLSLPGTLTMPARTNGKIPVALIVAGSGPTDRNGNSAGPLRAQNNSNLYAILAWQLAADGIASVRYDKRTLGDNLARVDLPATSIDDFVADVAAGAKALAADPRFSRVVLVGHSEGAELVLQAVNRGAPAAGIVMAAGAGRPILVVLREQLSKQLPPPEMVKWDSALARYLRGEEPGEVHPALRPMFLPQHRKFMRTWIEYDPASEIAKVKVPVLVVQGGRDLQVNEGDARALKAAQPAATLVVIPAANHVFRAAASDDRMAQLRLYTDPAIPIVPELTPAIAGWIKALRGG